LGRSSFYSFKQDNLFNPQWYERFNTKVDVSGDIGVTRQHKVLLEYVAQESYTRAFTDLGPLEQQLVRDDAEERYVSYAFLRQSGTQHSNLKVDLQNDFTTGDNHYPNNRQQTLHLLDKYRNTVVAKVTHSEGTSFAQKGEIVGSNRSISGSGKCRDSSTYDKKYWNDKECYKCQKKGHPATHCPKKLGDDDDCSTASAASSVKKLKEDIKLIKKAFTTVNTQLAQLKEADSDISESEGEEVSHFQVDQAIQFAQLDKKCEPRITDLFKQTGSSIKLDLKEVILLDSQSTMDLFCNTALVSKISKSRSNMRLNSNVGTMVVTRKATMEGYNKTVWFSTRSITNIIALRNSIDQYRVTYDSDDLMFVMHQESESKPNMEFKMHKIGLHYYDPRKEHHMTFVNTISENKTGFTKRQIKCAEIARNL
jgi:hypothetical protein